MLAHIHSNFCVDKDFFNRPFLLFRNMTDKTIDNLTKALSRKHEKEKKENPEIYCAACGHLITGKDNAISIAGGHRHHFINPAAISYDIVCFSSAKGCLNMGEPTMEFTWFPGYSWCYSVCEKCFTHLGWFYQSGNSQFYGLILNRLRRGKMK